MQVCTQCDAPKGYDGLCGNCADKASNVKTLTYGTLPSFKDFEAAFKKSACGSTYTIGFNDSDFNAAANLDLLFEGTYHTTYASRTGARWDYEYTCEQLYVLCKALVQAYEPGALESESDEATKWAGDFCASILSTLDFKWV